MKKKNIFIMASAALLLTACADTDIPSFFAEGTDAAAKQQILNGYDVLKNYVDRDKYPVFKMGGATSAAPFNELGQVYALDKANFDEVVTGNAFKYASVVDEFGNMNFGTIQTFINNATDAGLTVYGHTLCWHAQSQPKYLNKLIADKELNVDPNEKIETFVAANTPYNDGKFPFYPMGCEPPVVNGCIHFVGDGTWSQFFITNAINLPEGNYAAKLRVKASASTSATLAIQNGWGGDAQKLGGAIALEEGWNDIMVDMTGVVGGNYDFIFQPGTSTATFDIESLTIVKLESPAVEVETEVSVTTYQDGKFPFYPMGSEPEVINGSMHFVGDGEWRQFFCSTGNALTEGDYKAYFHIYSAEDTSLPIAVQNGWGGDAQKLGGNLMLSKGWNDAVLNLPGIVGGNYDFIAQPGTTKMTIDINKITIKKVEKLNKIPQTDEEKKDTLTWAMGTWIKGMMEACGGQVKAWDVVNEPMSDWPDPSQLKSGAREGGETNFYWQDYLGKDYARTAIAFAREYGPEDLKLFVNEYGIEGADGKKCDGLINMVKYWESDGVTKIDGIGSQMHVTYSLDADKQAQNEEGVVNMLNKLAATGKLIRISELDMGIADADGNTIKTQNVTPEQHEAMATYYKFIVSKYLELIPVAQQYGITAWGITDSPAGSGWRPEEPIGLWDANYNRKPAYAGFAEGLGAPHAE